MRMDFEPDDEDAFAARRDELVGDFGQWLAANHVERGDAGDAGVALDWKWGYADGALGTWTVADLQEFLLEWCPRKLSLPPQDCREFPASIGAFCTFLAARGLLSGASSGPKALQRYCERHTDRFVRKMSDPGKYGMAKGLFAGAGGLDPELSDTELDALRRYMEAPFDDEDDDGEPLTVGPVRLPEPEQQAASAAQAPVLAQLHWLAGYCAAPGRELDRDGELTAADVDQLVDLLETGDDPSAGSVEQLPELNWLLTVGLDAEVVQRYRGRMVAVARWSRLSAVEALDQIVDPALDQGLSVHVAQLSPTQEALRELVDEATERLLAELLEWRAVGRSTPVAELGELLSEVAQATYPGVRQAELALLRRWTREQVTRLAALGVVTVRDEPPLAELTAAGVPIAVRLAEDLGVTVLRAPDPQTATAGEYVDLVGHADAEQWRDDVRAWVAVQSAAGAARQLGAALAPPDREPAVVLTVLAELDALVGEHAADAARVLLGGVHDGLAVRYLAGTGTLDVEEIGPERMFTAVLDVLAVALDAGPDMLVQALDAERDRPDQAELVDQLWRVEHPRVGDLLEALGAQHPDKTVAKTARKSLLRYRSYTANRS